MKKFIILVLMSIFLIGAVGFISAADDFDDVVDSSDDNVKGYVDDSPVSDDNAGSSNEKVKLTVTMNWKDNGGSNRPTSVTVYVKNGNNTVETVVLSKDNGWSKTIDVDKYDGSGNQISYSVSADKIGSYKEPVVKSNGNEFTITNELSGVLSSSNTDVVKENNSNNSVNNGTDNSTDDNNTADDNKTSDDNKTDNGKKTDKTTNNNLTNITINKNTNVNNTTVNQVILKKSPNETHKNDTKKQDQKKPLQNTGNPLLILVVAIVIVGVAYYFYSKR